MSRQNINVDFNNLKNSEIRYIAETRDWVVDGILISESQLTESQIEKLRSLKKDWKLLYGNDKIEGKLIV